ncbi:hypothetical protein A2U01_0020396 [Trifolium medium]|uniref:Uncharacterized protein n=1 Tax=Trifolium medium TaxID=97028 RepID=A0A392NLP1_9FABA|nr:hypothetical protein [Trifolium medium]
MLRAGGRNPSWRSESEHGDDRRCKRGYLQITLRRLSRYKLEVEVELYQPPTAHLQKPVGLKYSPPCGPNQQIALPPPPPPQVNLPPVVIPIVTPGIPHLQPRKSRRHLLRPPPKM